MENLKKKQKEVLSRIMGSALQEITEQLEEETEVSHGHLIQEKFFEIISELDQGKNINLEQGAFCSVVLNNGLKNLEEELKKVLEFAKDQNNKGEIEKIGGDNIKTIAEEIGDEILLFESIMKTLSK